MAKRLGLTIVLVLYAALLVKVMVLKDLPMIRIGHLRFRFGGTHEGPPNLIPLRTIRLYLRGGGGWFISGINLLGNILLLLPIGFTASFLLRNMDWLKALLLGIATGLAIEVLQSILHVGIFDIDDVILNALGVEIGYWAYLLFQRLFQKVGARKALPAVLWIAAMGNFLWVS